MIKIITLILLFFSFISSSNSEIINKIVIDGNNRISNETFSVFGNYKIGDDYYIKDLDRLLKNLYETNFFKDVNVKIENGTLFIKVTENPIIQTVTINGVRSKPLVEKINENLKLKEKTSYVDYFARQDLNYIKAILKSNGYYFAEVKSSLIESDNNTVKLQYDILLGEKVLIKKIKFTGNKIFKDRLLRNIIVSEENRFWKFISKRKFLDANRVNLDLKLLENFYKNKGYYNVKIQNASAKLLDENEFELIFNISAGYKYYFKTLKLILPDDYDVNNFNEINNLFVKLEDEVYSYAKVEDILDEIDLIALQKQYEFIDATISEKIVEKNKLDFYITIGETEKYYVEKINILGNNVTVESVIRNSLIVDEGDAFNQILHNKSMNSLKGKGIFGTVKSETVEGSSKNQKIINIEVTEKPTGEISAGAGIGTSGGTIGFSLSENNFMGKDIKLGSSLTLSESKVKGLFSVTNPNFNYSDKSLRTSFEATETDKLMKYGYKTSKSGFTLGTTFEQYQNFYVSPEVSLFTEKLRTSNSASSNYKKQAGNYFDTSLKYSLSYDKRNQTYQTSDGFISRFNQTIPIVSNNAAILNGYTFTSYHEIFPETIGKLSFYMRAINSVSGDDVRVSKRLYLPARRLRGFESGRIGPVENDDFVGGNYASALNLSVSLPNFLRELENTDFMFFLDAGNVWGVDYSSTIDESNKIRSATGLAIDWYTPIGPLNFSLSAPLTKASTDKTETFRFNLGTTF